MAHIIGKGRVCRSPCILGHAESSVPTVKMMVSRGLPGVAADCCHLHVPMGVVMVVVLVSNGDCCSERGTYQVRGAQKILMVVFR